MRVRIASMFLLGAALTVHAAAASAQDTTRTTRTRARSQQRIRVTKEAPGEVAPRVDTVTVYRTDTLATTRVDTVMTTRYDTVQLPPPVLPIRYAGGVYFGLGAGPSIPKADFDNSAQTGYHGEAQLGVDPIGSPLGLRADLGYSAFEPFDRYNAGQGRAQILNLAGDLKLRLPTRALFNKRFQLYALGGGQWDRYKNIVEAGHGAVTMGDQTATPITPTTAGQTITFNNTSDSWHSAWGWNAGGGFQFGWGKTNMFVESRYMKFNGRVDLTQIPVVVGFTWY